jgi:hypothetical protein
VRERERKRANYIQAGGGVGEQKLTKAKAKDESGLGAVGQIFVGA